MNRMTEWVTRSQQTIYWMNQQTPNIVEMVWNSIQTHTERKHYSAPISGQNWRINSKIHIWNSARTSTKQSRKELNLWVQWKRIRYRHYLLLNVNCSSVKNKRTFILQRNRISRPTPGYVCFSISLSLSLSLPVSVCVLARFCIANGCDILNDFISPSSQVYVRNGIGLDRFLFGYCCVYGRVATIAI